MASDDCIEALVSLGFTALESEIYTFLLQESPVTGYRVAQALGKPTANTYKAIESLALKGAVIVAEGAQRHCRAVPAQELLNRLDRRFTAHDAARSASRYRWHSTQASLTIVGAGALWLQTGMTSTQRG